MVLLSDQAFREQVLLYLLKTHDVVLIKCPINDGRNANFWVEVVLN